MGDIVKFGRVRFRVKELVVKETFDAPSDEEQPEYLANNHELEPSGLKFCFQNYEHLSHHFIYHMPHCVFK